MKIGFWMRHKERGAPGWRGDRSWHYLGALPKDKPLEYWIKKYPKVDFEAGFSDSEPLDYDLTLDES